MSLTKDIKEFMGDVGREKFAGETEVKLRPNRFQLPSGVLDELGWLAALTETKLRPDTSVLRHYHEKTDSVLACLKLVALEPSIVLALAAETTDIKFSFNSGRYYVLLPKDLYSRLLKMVRAKSKSIALKVLPDKKLEINPSLT